MVLNFKIVEFHSFFEEEIQNNVLDSLLTYNLIENDVIKFRKAETKRIISYFIIYHITKKVRKRGKEKSVVVVQPKILNKDISFFDYIDTEALEVSICTFIRKTLKILSKSTPNQVILFSKQMITEFVEELDIKDIKDKVLKELEDIYNKSITKVNIEGEQ